MSFLTSLMSLFRRPMSTRCPAPRRTSLGIEALEGRALMSVTSISGFVYNDLNHNGIKDAGEVGIANNNLVLVNSSNQVIAHATTNGNGYYEFTHDETVVVTPQTLTQTLDFANATTGWTKSGTINQLDPSVGTLTSIDIVNSDTMTTEVKLENLDNLPATIVTNIAGNVAFNGPGVSNLSSVLSTQQSFNASAFDGNIDFAGTSGHDTGLVTVQANSSTTLTAAGDLAAYIGTGQVTLTATAQTSSTSSGSANLLQLLHTTAAGHVQIVYHYLPNAAIKPGNYTIVQPQEPNGYFDGLETSGNIAPIPGSIGTDSIPITVGTSSLTNNNFGEVLPASLSGVVYTDKNNNGIQNAGDAGIAGVTVQLDGTDDRGIVVHQSTVTAPDGWGSYAFTNLRPGNYSISESQPGYFLDGKDTVGSLGASGTPNDQFLNINVNSGDNGIHYNFGEILPASLSGVVYTDKNNNGIQDAGDAGIAGVTVWLDGTDDRGAVVHLSTVTAADGWGSYAFTNLRPGNYSISESQPVYFLDGKDTPGSLGASGTPNDQFLNINVNSGDNGVHYNFGEILPASLSGSVYVDANNNGDFEPGEAPIAGVQITLTGTNDLGNSVTLTTQTGSDGSYLFAALRPGSYHIHETQPAGYLDGLDTIGSQGGVSTNDDFFIAALATSTNGIHNNFGEQLVPPPVTVPLSPPPPPPTYPSKFWFLASTAGS
jgi:hypothetical protein